jgi:Condensation domain
MKNDLTTPGPAGWHSGEAPVAARSTPLVRQRFPLSFAQQRLWFLDQLYPGTAVYNIPAAMRLRGWLDQPALARALAVVIDRHHILRTRFLDNEGEPWQEVFASPPVQLPSTDLSSIPEHERQSELQRRVRAEARRAFDLTGELLLRTHLFRLAQEEHVLVLNIHHIASDLYSFRLLFEDLNEAYEAVLANRPPRLPDLPIQYSDYAVRQRAQANGKALQPHMEYWRMQLAGAPAVMDLPTDRPRPAVPSFNGQRCARMLQPELISALKKLSRDEGATPFMLFLAAFKTLLYRLTLQEDLLVGAPIAGRNRADIERMIGFFSNTIVLRSRPCGTLSFREFLGQMRAATLEAFAHQDLPFEKLVRELSPSRSLNHAPLVQVMFVLQPPLGENIAFPGLVVSAELIDCETAKFDLTFTISTGASGWTAEIEYDSDLFDRETIERWLNNFEVLLKDITANPGRQLRELRMLSEAERNETTRAAPEIKKETSN